MAKTLTEEVPIESEQEEEQLSPTSVSAVVTGADWTTETIVSQLRRENILLNPRFQRRDAWKRDRKSRFIESLIVGLPIPQIVLAESKQERGKFLVLDGKQRLLSILQFWGFASGENNSFSLSGLTLRKDLTGKTYAEISTKPAYDADFNSLLNRTIRTVVILNWPDSDFLHTVFLRLNTGSVNLSPQELRQALLPGSFSNYVDNAAAASVPLQNLLGLSGPDARMRDIEVLARFFAFRFFAETYPGRMKKFLDSTFETYNEEWPKYETKLEEAMKDFEAGVNDLVRIFNGEVARKPGSRQFNRAIFDALIFFQSQEKVRLLLEGKEARVRQAYNKLFDGESAFLKAVESDTAGAPNTSMRLATWARALSSVCEHRVAPPKIPVAGEKGSSRTKHKGAGRNKAS